MWGCESSTGSWAMKTIEGPATSIDLIEHKQDGI